MSAPPTPLESPNGGLSTGVSEQQLGHQLLQLMQILFCLFALLITLRLFFLQDYGRLQNATELLGDFSVGGLFFLLPWHRWVHTTRKRQYVLGAAWLWSCFFAFELAWNGGYIGWWLMPLFGGLSALVYMAFELDTPRLPKPWMPKRWQIAYLAGWLLGLIVMWYLCLSNPEVNNEAQWMARGSLGLVLFMGCWVIGLQTYRAGATSTLALTQTAYFATLALTVFLLFTNVFGSWLDANSTHPVLTEKRWPIYILATLILASLSFSKARRHLRAMLWVPLVWHLYLPWVLPEQAPTLLPSAAVLWFVVMPVGRWTWTLLGFGCTLLLYGLAGRLEHAPLLLHGLSSFTVLSMLLWAQTKLRQDTPLTPLTPADQAPGLALEKAKALSPEEQKINWLLSLLAFGLPFVLVLGTGVQLNTGNWQSLALLAAMLGAVVFESARAYMLWQSNLRQQSQAQLELLNKIMAYSSKGFALFRADGSLLKTNALFASSHEQSQILSIHLFTHPIYVASGLANLAQRALAGHGQQHMQYQGPGTVKAHLDLQWTVDLVELSGIPHLLLQSQDLTEIHAQEAARTKELLESNERLNRVQHELQTVLDTASVGLMRVNHNREYIWVNQEMANMYGYSSPEELIGQDSRIMYASEMDYEAAALLIAAHAKQSSGTFEMELRLVRKNGEIGVFAMRTSKLTSEAELIYAVRDVTEERKREQQLQQALRDANAASEAKSYFLSVMSHELRTPLNGVMGSFQILNWMSLDDKARDMVQTGMHTAQLLLALLNDVLEHARMAAGQLQITTKPHNLYQCLKAVQDMFMNIPQRDAVKLSFDLQPELQAVVLVDELRLRQMLMNLINNALKFTELGSVQVKALCLPSQQGLLTMQVKVIDTGIGMNEEALSRLYQPFMQADEGSSRKYQGTGLGLSIVHSLVQAMGASIQVSSTPSLGTTFTLDFNFVLANTGDVSTPLQELPLSAAGQSHLPQPSTLHTQASVTGTGQTLSSKSSAADTSLAKVRPDATLQQATPPSSTSQGLLHGMQVAVVDDRSLNRKVARMMLEQSGAGVHEFEDGSTLLNALRTTPLGDQLHAVLMDLQMEPMDGFQTTRLIRAETQASWHTLPIIAMTGNLMHDEEKKTAEVGMNGFLSKPLDYKTTIELLRTALAKPD